MPCFNPLRGWKSSVVNESGKRSLVFKESQAPESLRDFPIDVPCGQCIGCRLERSRQWALRCLNEASLYDNNCFITLTYDEDHLPKDGSLHKEHFQKFMKRLRKMFPRTKGDSIRYFHCGEYGEQLGRPHYHACIFNFDFNDKKLWKINNGERYYTSDTLSKLWPDGYSIIGNVTFESAAYVARYIMKKVTGDVSESHYDGKTPEYTTMSRRPGIGKQWFDKYADDIRRTGHMVVNGKRVMPPKFYEKELEKYDNDMLLMLKRERKRQARLHKDDNTIRRLRDREEVKTQQTRTLFRPIEGE